MEEGQSAGQFVYDRLKSERYLEGFWMDIEDHTSSIREIVDQTHTEEERRWFRYGICGRFL